MLITGPRICGIEDCPHGCTTRCEGHAWRLLAPEHYRKRLQELIAAAAKDGVDLIALAAEPENYEHQRAIMEGERNESLEQSGFVTTVTVRAFERGFTNGWDRAQRQQSGVAVPAWISVADHDRQVAEAVTAERTRCYDLTIEQPMRKGIFGGNKPIYWTDNCKAMAFDLSCRIRSPEQYDANGDWVAPAEAEDDDPAPAAPAGAKEGGG